MDVVRNHSFIDKYFWDQRLIRGVSKEKASDVSDDINAEANASDVDAHEFGSVTENKSGQNFEHSNVGKAEIGDAHLLSQGSGSNCTSLWGTSYLAFVVLFSILLTYNFLSFLSFLNGSCIHVEVTTNG